VHGLTMLTIDGIADIPQLTTEKLARKVANLVCGGLLRR
jgi:hypothetical protein